MHHCDRQHGCLSHAEYPCLATYSSSDHIHRTCTPSPLNIAKNCSHAQTDHLPHHSASFTDIGRYEAGLGPKRKWTHEPNLVCKLANIAGGAHTCIQTKHVAAPLNEQTHKGGKTTRTNRASNVPHLTYHTTRSKNDLKQKRRREPLEKATGR